MKFRALLFDINGTVSDILTNEGEDNLYRVVANFLEYQGIFLSPDALRERYFELNRKQRHGEEEFAEFDVVALFRELIESAEKAMEIPPERRAILPELTAEVFRAASRYKLQLYHGVREVLDGLKDKYALAAVSDGQRLWAVPELRSVGLLEYFDPIVISSDYGYRKPDRRMYEHALNALNIAPSEALFIGNDIYRDVYGAQQAGMKCVFFKSNQGEHFREGVESDYLIRHFSELPEAIAFLEGASKN